MNSEKQDHPVLRVVRWRNLWNWTQEEAAGKYHLTVSETREGQTLCGRRFPVEKGHSDAVRLCRRCKSIASKKHAFTVEQFRTLAHVA